MSASSNGDVKSIPIRCLIEVRSEEKQCSTSTGSIQPETESFAIVPSNSLFRDVVRTVLTKLGYSAQDSSNAKGAVQIKNWRPLDLEQVTDNALVSVEDMLGDLTTVATLRIKITSKGKSEDVKDKLLLMLLEQSYEVLTRKGCPIAKDELERVVAGHGEFSSAKQADFYSWYSKQQNPSNYDEVIHHTEDNKKIHRPTPLTIPSPVRTPRLRITFDSEEVTRLQHWYELDPHPSRQLMTKYLADLKELPSRGSANKQIDLTNIMYWFKNARAAARRQGRSVTSEDLSEDEGLSERESMSAPPLPNSNAVYVIRDPLVGESEDKSVATGGDKSVDITAVSQSGDESDMEDELSVGDSEMESSSHQSPNAVDVSADTEIKLDGSMQNKLNSNTGVLSTSSSPKLPNSLMNSNGMAARIPGYPFPYGALPMAYLQTQMHPFYKDWSEKFQSAVAQAQANTAQQNLASSIKHENVHQIKADHELSKAERQKRHRAFIDPVSEIPKLEQWFTKDTHPSHYVIEQICDDLNRGEFRSRYPKLSPKNIQLWFKNHRAKVKRMRVGGGLNFSGVGSPQLSPPSGIALSMME